MPAIFTDPGWTLISTSILSTSNCGNPALRLFGFGPVAADGYGIGYIIKEDGLSVYVFLYIPHLQGPDIAAFQVRILEASPDTAIFGYVEGIPSRRTANSHSTA
jgi:hypothetical protein